MRSTATTLREYLRPIRERGPLRVTVVNEDWHLPDVEVQAVLDEGLVVPRNGVDGDTIFAPWSTLHGMIIHGGAT